MPIKLIALDIDGTLLTPRGELTPRNLDAINQARARGVHIVLVTGRRFGSAYQLLQEIKLDVALVAHNGALTKDLKTLETIDLHPLTVATAHRVVETAREFGADMICCYDEPHGPGKMAIDFISSDNVGLQRYLRKYSDALVRVPDLIAFIEQPPVQLMFSGRCIQMDEFAELLRQNIGDDIRLFKTRYPSVDLTILDAISATASKGDCVAKIAADRGIAREEVMAVGDNHNDLTMLHYAGLGVVMGNAEDELKQLGFIETASNEESGVAAAIEKYVLAG